MESMEIDDSLYSRQRYVLGDDAMRRMAASRVFLHGLGGVGVEVAKNLCLAGVKGLTVQDDRPAVTEDLGCQFFLRPADVEAGRTRAEVCHARLAELNPYVKVERLAGDLNRTADLSLLEPFQCVVLTDYTLDLLKRCDRFCREHGIRLVAADVFGVFGVIFCDFGPGHEVRDRTGEEPRRVLVGRISQAARGVVDTLDDAFHGLESGDVVTFAEVKGMTALNGTQHAVTVLSPTSFSIGDTEGLPEYAGGGIAQEVKVPRSVSHRCLEDELHRPSTEAPDMGRLQAPAELHLLHLALLHALLPNADKRDDFLARDSLPTDTVEEALLRANDKFSVVEPSQVDKAALVRMAQCSAGGARLAPLCAFFGGVAAQEALKAVTGKFAPLSQWLYLDARDLLPPPASGDGRVHGGPEWSSRYAHHRRCLGDELVLRLMAQRLFLVGCGAIGCELLKNLALLGVGAGRCSGEIVITDNDVIEKSNLNRQFLFRERHIRSPKSHVAADATVEINNDVTVEARLDKVCEATEENLFSDAFFATRDVCVNALDNVPTRVYMDARCVAAQRPLLESGTMGTKGHVQVIVPHLTETYSSQADPPEAEIPYCTLKSFPSSLEHCIEWARDKFESQFAQKPQLLRRFTDAEALDGPEGARRVAQKLAGGEHVEDSLQASRYLRSKCTTWRECVRGARLKFNKYFNHKALQLLHSYPLDCRLQDGTPFWQSPKRPPRPIGFDPHDETHVSFLRSCARLLADVGAISYSAADLETSALLRQLDGFVPPPFRPSNKHIETDEKVTREVAEQRRAVSGGGAGGGGGTDAEGVAVRVFEALSAVAGDPERTALWTAVPLSFEKDDDENGHIDFVTAASNLRAAMYELEGADRFRVKLIAGRIVPAIATTTAAVAGLVTVELLRLAAARAPHGRSASPSAGPDSISRYRNAFLNLALPTLVLSEPGECPPQRLPGGATFTAWDRWEVRLGTGASVAAFLSAIQARFGVEPCSVMQGSRIVYLPFLPNHHKRLKRPITDFIRLSEHKPYVDLLVTTEDSDTEGAAGGSGEDDDEDDENERVVSCPTVRLYIRA